MAFFAAILLTLELTAGYSDGFAWKLALNINPDDGHNFGWGASAWDDTKDVGSNGTAFTADYKSYDVTLETANFIAIIRHQDGVCEAARVWKFLAVGKTLHEYMNIQKTGRLVATDENCTSSYISPTMANKEKDPIFALDGALVFNWWHFNDGARIANSNAHCKTSLPATGENTNSFFGLGNDLAGNQNGGGSTTSWSDVGVQDCSLPGKDRAQGTDHGTSQSDGEVYGQYAVYVSEDVETFICNKDHTLLTAMHGDKYFTDFHRVERDGDNMLNFVEFVFDKADVNKDGVLSRMEFSTARLNHRFVKTADKDVLTDFTRIDKDGDGVLDIDEMEFDIADTNKDGELSYHEYYEARVVQEITDTE